MGDLDSDGERLKFRYSNRKIDKPGTMGLQITIIYVNASTLMSRKEVAILAQKRVSSMAYLLTYKHKKAFHCS
jgi:hypothetical protein